MSFQRQQCFQMWVYFHIFRFSFIFLAISARHSQAAQLIDDLPHSEVWLPMAPTLCLWILSFTDIGWRLWLPVAAQLHDFEFAFFLPSMCFRMLCFFELYEQGGWLVFMMSKVCSWVLWGSWTETEDQASRTGRTGRTLASKQNWLSTFTFWGISLILTFSESKICGTTCKCVDLAIRNFNANNHGKPLSTKRCGEQLPCHLIVDFHCIATWASN